MQAQTPLAPLIQDMLLCMIMRRYHSLPAPVAAAAGIAFEFLVRACNIYHDSRYASPRHLPGPVISIGNLTMGGTGKTPLVLFTTRLIADLGFSPVILTRGYGRRNPGKSIILTPWQSIRNEASFLGDEPALMRRYLPDIWMGISGNRFRTGDAIARQQPGSVFLLDDGFQHRRLHRDLDIVVIDSSQPLASNRIFPTGTLREPVAGLKRCHMVIINGIPETRETAFVHSTVKDLHEKAPVFVCTQRIRDLVPYDSWKDGGTTGERPLSQQRVFLVAAIGNPDRFQRDMLRAGCEIGGTRFFRDHYQLTSRDWADCADEARSCSATMIATTEKDAAKISRPPEFPMAIAVQQTEISDPSDFGSVITNCIEKRFAEAVE
jgi:tetraacyldisaccharide 4'-kinase